MKLSPSLNENFDPASSLVLYQVKHGDTVSKILSRTAGQATSKSALETSLKLFKTLNPQITDINRIYSGQWILLSNPIYGQNFSSDIASLSLDAQNFHSAWKNTSEQEKSFLVEHWDTIDLFSNISSRTDNIIMTALPEITPTLNSTAIKLGTSIEEAVKLQVIQMQRLIIEQRKNATRFVFQYFEQMKVQKYIVVSFKPGRFFSLTQKLESLIAISKKFRFNLVFIGIDIATGVAEVGKTYIESQDGDISRRKTGEVTGKIIGAASTIPLGKAICGVSLEIGIPFGPPGIATGVGVCIGGVFATALAGEAAGKYLGKYLGSWGNSLYHWMASPAPVNIGKKF